MNRRHLIKRAGAALLALPFLALRKPDVMLTETRLQQKSFPAGISVQTHMLCLDDLRLAKGNLSMIAIAARIEEMLQGVMFECQRDQAVPSSIRIKWVNIPDPVTNPHGNLGYFRLFAYRWRQVAQSGAIPRDG